MHIMKTYLMLEICVEVAWQIGDLWPHIPRAEARWNLADITLDIINSGIIDDKSENIDETISAYLNEHYGDLVTASMEGV